MKRSHLELRATPPSISSHLAQYTFVSVKRRLRGKRHLAWEQSDQAAGGLYTRNLTKIAHRYPLLTPMELRVSALVMALLPSWRIGEMLGITEKSVENLRVKARRKMGIGTQRLSAHLAQM
jgi:DNA-binding CsgD family transcriptional regulator